jgi:hypothetical protein
VPPVLNLAIAFVVAAVTGIGSAHLAIKQGRLFGAVSAGSWIAWPASGSLEADPYSLAVLARTGEIQLGDGEGIAFAATTDSDGDQLSGACVYRVSGETPAARLWTLTAYDAAGRLMPNPANRTGYHSREILRNPAGGFVITVSADVAAGNWLPIGRPERFSLMLRLYDTPLTTGSQITSLIMPQVHKVGCL